MNRILEILDSCCDNFTFPMLDNGYVYLAASRLSAFRSPENWHLAIEIFGFSTRSEIPDINIYHFGSNVIRNKQPESFVTQEAYDSYSNNNPHNESDVIFPIEEGDWIDLEEEAAIPGAIVEIRGKEHRVPTREECQQLGLVLEDARLLYIYEFCRAIATTSRELVLATEDEVRKLVPADLELVLSLDEWNHPNVVDPDMKLSDSETFQQIASVLETGQPSLYAPTSPPNTHWSHWPDGGSL